MTTPPIHSARSHSNVASPAAASSHHHGGLLATAFEVITAIAAALLLLELLNLVDLNMPEFVRHLIEGTLHTEKVWGAVVALAIWLSPKWAPLVELFTFIGGMWVLLWQHVLHIARLGMGIAIVFGVILAIGHIVKTNWPERHSDKIISAPQPVLPKPKLVVPLHREGIECILLDGSSLFVASDSACYAHRGAVVAR